MNKVNNLVAELKTKIIQLIKEEGQIIRKLRKPMSCQDKVAKHITIAIYRTKIYDYCNVLNKLGRQRAFVKRVSKNYILKSKLKKYAKHS